MDRFYHKVDCSGVSALPWVQFHSQGLCPSPLTLRTYFPSCLYLYKHWCALLRCLLCPIIFLPHHNYHHFSQRMQYTVLSLCPWHCSCQGIPGLCAASALSARLQCGPRLLRTFFHDHSPVILCPFCWSHAAVITRPGWCSVMTIVFHLI